MLYMAFTVAKKYQPAIIYIDEVEEIFKAGKGVAELNLLVDIHQLYKKIYSQQNPPRQKEEKEESWRGRWRAELRAPQEAARGVQEGEVPEEGRPRDGDHVHIEAVGHKQKGAEEVRREEDLLPVPELRDAAAAVPAVYRAEGLLGNSFERKPGGYFSIHYSYPKVLRSEFNTKNMEILIILP